MKTITLTTLGLLFMVSFHLHGQAYHGVKSYPIYKVGAKLVDEFDKNNYEIVRIEYDLIFQTKSAESFRNLSPDWEYTIIGFADEGVKDLDLKLYEYDDLLEKWVLLTSDESTEAQAFLSITPDEWKMYKVEIIASEFHEGYTAARYGLMYVHE